jgi:hypothetical protein
MTMNTDWLMSFVGEANVEASAQFLSDSGPLEELFAELGTDEYERIAFLGNLLCIGTAPFDPQFGALSVLNWCVKNGCLLATDDNGGTGVRSLLDTAGSWSGWSPAQRVRFILVLAELEHLIELYSASPLRACALPLLGCACVAQAPTFKFICKKNRVKPNNVIRAFRQDGVIDSSALKLLEMRL